MQYQHKSERRALRRQQREELALHMQDKSQARGRRGRQAAAAETAVREQQAAEQQRQRKRHEQEIAALVKSAVKLRLLRTST